MKGITYISPGTWVLTGFGISLLSVVINVIVLSGINERIKATDDELSKLTTSLSIQAAEMNWAEIKSDLFVVLNHVSRLSTNNDVRRMAAADAIQLIQGYL